MVHGGSGGGEWYVDGRRGEGGEWCADGGWYVGGVRVVMVCRWWWYVGRNQGIMLML